MNLTEAQREQLLKPINPRRVGKDGKGFAHLEAYDIRAHLSRIFGIGGWSCVVSEMQLVFETASEGEKQRWTVCYRAKVELTIGAGEWINGLNGALATYTEWATGDATNMPSRADAHDMAIKTAESQALKRCAVNLGDQFGLSLYAKGSTSAVVGKVIPWSHDAGEVEQPVVPESLERGMPPKDVQTNADEPSAVVEPEPTADARQEQRTVDAILKALPQVPGEKPAQWVNRLTKARVDAARYSVGAVEVDGLPLEQQIQHATEEALALLGTPS